MKQSFRQLMGKKLRTAQVLPKLGSEKRSWRKNIFSFVRIVLLKLCKRSREQKYVNFKRAAKKKNWFRTKKKQETKKENKKVFLESSFSFKLSSFCVLSLRFVLCRNCFAP
jgi:hypothetical protein